MTKNDVDRLALLNYTYGKLFKSTATPRMYVKLSSSEEINFCPECTADCAELMNKGMDQEERQRAEIIADLLMKEQGII